MGFGEAVSTCLGKYATFDGRATRPEYWWWALFSVIVYVVAVILDLATHTFLIGLIVTLGLLLPTIAVTVRRLHDTGRSGWWYFIALIPLIGGIWLIVILAQPSTVDSSADAPYATA